MEILTETDNFHQIHNVEIALRENFTIYLLLRDGRVTNEPTDYTTATVEETSFNFLKKLYMLIFMPWQIIQ